jgi:hypothetical protein
MNVGTGAICSYEHCIYTRPIENKKNYSADISIYRHLFFKLLLYDIVHSKLVNQMGRGLMVQRAGTYACGILKERR